VQIPLDLLILGEEISQNFNIKIGKKKKKPWVNRVFGEFFLKNRLNTYPSKI
jgi:hypothetical protein